MTIKCKEGIEYACSHLKDCDSDKGVVSFVNTSNMGGPQLIYLHSKKWSRSTKTWSDRHKLYSCQPENLIIHEETFYDQDLNQEKKNLSKEILNGIEELMFSKGLVVPGR
jgi:hypothetical protein